MEKKGLIERYRGKNVFLTGHTGFKGSWLTKILLDAGAYVTGYSLNPPTSPSLFELAQLEDADNLNSIVGDIRDYESLLAAFCACEPDVVLHLAAQPIVRESYREPVRTYSTNVMGTVNLLEAARKYSDDNPSCILSILNVTTDKVYKNNEWYWGYREDEPLDGYDPYSNSKSCSELVTHSYTNSFFYDGRVRVSTARAGNVVGGGDFSIDRIIPDCVRALELARSNKEASGKIQIRNPKSIRPYQHVLEPIFAYLMIAFKQYEDEKYCGYYNVGPDESDCKSTQEVVDIFRAYWNNLIGNGFLKGSRDLPELDISVQADLNAFHENKFLKLDCSRIKSVFGWQPTWKIDKALEETAKFIEIYLDDGDVSDEMSREIACFLNPS